MPIKGLTDKNSVTPRFTRLGKIRKGVKQVDPKTGKERMIDLDFFRFTGEGQHAAEIERAFHDAYGAEPVMIRVFLPFATVDENWQTWMEEWGASGLIHRCDGEFMVQWQNPDLTYSKDYDCHQRKPCPYCSGEKERTEQKPGCDHVGRLAVMIPELLELGYLGYVTVETHSINDLANITASLTDAYNKAQDAHRPNGLQGIEFSLRREFEQIGVRYFNQKAGKYIKTRGDKWMIRIDPSREWALAQIETSRRMALGAQIDMPALTVDGDFEAVETDCGLLPESETEAQVLEAETVEPEPEAPAEPMTFEQAADFTTRDGVRYGDMTVDKLTVTKETLKTWMEKNQGNEAYTEAEERVRAIVKVIEAKINDDAAGRETIAAMQAEADAEGAALTPPLF